jgi:hypothetical protein
VAFVEVGEDRLDTFFLVLAKSDLEWRDGQRGGQRLDGRSHNFRCVSVKSPGEHARSSECLQRIVRETIHEEVTDHCRWREIS